MTAAGPDLTLYVRQGCHLCDDMQARLQELQPRLKFSLSSVDVDADPVLEARYGDLVPVLTDGDQQICHYFLDELALEKLAGGV